MPAQQLLHCYLLSQTPTLPRLLAAALQHATYKAKRQALSLLQEHQGPLPLDW